MPKVSKHSMRKTRTKKKPAKGVLSRIKPIGFDESEGIKINLYGRSGTGKTTTWATFPKPILAIVCSGSTKTGELRSIDTEEYRKTIDSITIEKSSEIAEITNSTEPWQYNTIVLDHATGLQDLILREVLGIEELPAKLGWGVAEYKHWGKVGIQITGIFRALLNLNCNVVIVAQDRESHFDSDDELLTPSVGNALTPGTATWLNNACDYRCYTFRKQKMKEVRVKIGGKTVVTQKEDKGVDYCLRTGPHGVYDTKFRIPKGQELPEFIVDPSYAKIMALINQS